MGTQWARKQAHTNELAAAVESATQWLRLHQQAAVWGAIAVIGSMLAITVSVNRLFTAREEAWGKLAIAQSYAYSNLPDQALSQVKSLAEEHPSNPASGYGGLLAGDIFFQQSRYKEAAYSYRKILDQAQHKALIPLAMAGLGLSQEAQADLKAAVDTDQRFLDAYQDHFMAPQVHASLARCFKALGQPDKEKAAYERIAFLYPDTYWAQWAKARIKS